MKTYRNSTTEELLDEKAKLSSEVESLQKTVLYKEVIEKSCEELEERNNSIEKLILSSQDKLETIQSELLSAQKKLEDFKLLASKEVSDKESEIKSLNSIVWSVNEERSQAQEQLKMISEKLSESTKSLESNKTELSELLQDISEMTTIGEALNLSIYNINKDIEDYKLKKEKLSLEIAEKTQALVELDVKIKQQENESLCLESEIAGMMIEKKKIEDFIVTSNEEIKKSKESLEKEYSEKFSDVQLKNSDILFRESVVADRTEQLRGIKMELEKHLGKQLKNIII